MAGVDPREEEVHVAGVEEDPGWAHYKPITDSKKRVKCNWCGKEMSGGVTRLKQHLAGI